MFVHCVDHFVKEINKKNMKVVFEFFTQTLCKTVSKSAFDIPGGVYDNTC